MRPVGYPFLRSLRGTHQMVSRARVVTTWQEGTDPDGTEIPILDGDVQFDATADVLGSVELVTEGRAMWPGQASSLLAPFGNEVFVERGLRYGNGVTEWVSLGYFRIDAPEQESSPDGPIRISGKDRMALVRDARLIRPRVFDPTWLRVNVLDNLVRELYPSVVIEWNDPNGTDAIGRTMLCEEDRYGFALDLVTSVGMTMRWDYRGRLIVDPVPTGTPASVWDIDQGREGVLVSMGRQLSREGTYNGVAAYGEAGDTVPPVRGTAIDGNPASPTYWYGRFGKVPRFYSSPFIVSATQATSAAQAILRQSLGLPYNVNFGAIPNPALEVDDTIQVKYPEESRSPSSRTERHRIEQLTIPLTAAAPMTGRTREQTLVVIGEV